MCFLFARATAALDLSHDANLGVARKQDKTRPRQMFHCLKQRLQLCSSQSTRAAASEIVLWRFRSACAASSSSNVASWINRSCCAVRTPGAKGCQTDRAAKPRPAKRSNEKANEQRDPMAVIAE